LSIYLDASAIVPLFLPDAFVGRVTAFFSGRPTDLILSDFAAAEFSSVVGLRVRMKLLTMANARKALSNFDVWTKSETVGAEMLSADVRTATGYLRRLDLTLRAPDAINLAIAHRSGARIATFDKNMARSARTLGMPVVAI
jgi:predicted nucleic acid-binding protein